MGAKPGEEAGDALVFSLTNPSALSFPTWSFPECRWHSPSWQDAGLCTPKELRQEVPAGGGASGPLGARVPEGDRGPASGRAARRYRLNPGAFDGKTADGKTAAALFSRSISSPRVFISSSSSRAFRTTHGPAHGFQTARNRVFHKPPDQLNDRVNSTTKSTHEPRRSTAQALGRSAAAVLAARRAIAQRARISVGLPCGFSP